MVMDRSLRSTGSRPLDAGEAALVSVLPTDAWVYGGEVDGQYRIWSGSRCAACRQVKGELQRCATHKDLQFVASQYRLA